MIIIYNIPPKVITKSKVGSLRLNLVYTSAPNGSRTACERFANQMHVCVDRTANLLCTVREWFAYQSPRTKICLFFVRTQRELDAPAVLSMHRMSFACLMRRT